jgi:hypothetical protein
MSENTPYRHEDIEALLMSKSFPELLEEEKSFVLQHIAGEEEYSSMRELLLQMHDLEIEAELKDPPESLETALLHGFTEHSQKVRSYERRFAPWMGWAIAATVLGAALIFFWPNTNPEELAVTEEVGEDSDKQSLPSIDSIPTEVPKPVIEVPTVVLPSEVENLLAQVVNASIPEPPSIADYVYDSEESAEAVVTEINEEKSIALTEAPTEELDVAATQSGREATEDVAYTAAPAVSSTTQAESLSSVQVKASKKVTAEKETASKNNRKKSRNPDVMRMSQSKRLKSLLRSE